jgi:hypothetical protein
MDRKLQAMVDYALSKVGCGYIYGASGWVCSEARRKQQAAQYPEHAAKIMGTGAKWDGRQCFDCAQLTRFAADAAGLKLPSGATSQWNSNNWTAKGLLMGMPPEPCIVFRHSNNVMQHVGIFLGEGWCVDARGTDDGVIRSRFDGNYKWTHFALPNIGQSASVPMAEPPYTARIKTQTGNGVSLWVDNGKTVRVTSVPEGSVVNVIGKPDSLGFALSEFDGMRGVGDTQYMTPLAGTPDLPPPELPPWDDREAWQKIAASYALLTQAANMMGDTLQDFGK